MITGFQHLQGCISSVDARVQALDAKVERCLPHLESDDDDDDVDEDLDKMLCHLFIFIMYFENLF